MDDEIYDCLKMAQGIEPLSRDSYVRKLHRVKKICIEWFGDPDLSFTRILLQPTHTLAAIKNESSDLSVQGNLVRSLLAVINHTPTCLVLPESGYPSLEQLHIKWSNILAPISRGIEADRASGTPKNVHSLLPWSRVYDNNTRLREKAYISRSLTDTGDLILSDMYVLLEPRRVLDYTRLFIKKEVASIVPPEVTGVIDLSLKRPTIVISVFKTHKTERDWTRELPRQLVKDVCFSLEVNPR